MLLGTGVSDTVSTFEPLKVFVCFLSNLPPYGRFLRCAWPHKSEGLLKVFGPIKDFGDSRRFCPIYHMERIASHAKAQRRVPEHTRNRDWTPLCPEHIAPPWAPDPLMVGIRSPDGLVVGLAPATLEFWVRFPNERNQGKQGANLC